MPETIQDILRRNRSNLTNNILIPDDAEPIFGITPELNIAATHSPDVQNAVQDFIGDNILADTVGAFGLGAGKMMNDTIVGGTGLILGGLGRGVEAISPFSGWDNDTLTHLANLGLTPQQAYEISPHRDSWLTSAAKGTLGIHNAIEDQINSLRTSMLGDNPSKVAEVLEGSGSSIGFLLSGLLLGSNPFTGALWAGASEALSEAGGFMGDAYRQGMYDNGALSTAGKSFLANLILNTGLNATVGRFNPYIDAIKNPFVRWGLTFPAEQINELLQEPSQQVIQQAAQNSLANGTDFLPELGQSVKQWPELFTQLAPTVAASTFLTTLLLGPGGPGYMYTRRGRQNIANQNLLSRYDTTNNGLLQTRELDPAKVSPQRPNVNSVDPNLLLRSTADSFNALSDLANSSALEDSQDMSLQNFVNADTIEKQIEALKPFLESGQLPTINNNQNENVQDTSQVIDEEEEEEEEEAPKPKKGRKAKGKKRKKNDAENKPSNYMEEETQDEAEKLSDFVPTSDTVKAYEAKNKLGSNTARIRTAKGTEVDVRYRIVDADELIASTKETGAPNPNYPQELQPRQRNREASHEQIDRIARTLDPELLGANRIASDGAPVIGPDMVVESGNGRVLALRRAYKIGNTENYKSWLRENAEMFGLTPEDVDSVNKPVLVRERISDVDRVKFTSEANEASIASMSSSEHALDDAKLITYDLLQYYDPDLPLESNREFVSRVIAKMPENEGGDSA